MVKSSAGSSSSSSSKRTHAHATDELVVPSFLARETWDKLGDWNDTLVIEHTQKTLISKRSKTDADVRWEVYEHYAHLAAGLFWAIVVFHFLMR